MIKYYEKLIFLKNKLYFLGIFLGGSLFFFQLFTTINEVEKIKFFLRVKFSFIVVLILIFILAYIVQMAIWRNILISLGFKLPIKLMIRGYWLSFLPRYLPGSIWGYLSRNEWLLNEIGTPRKITTIASILEILVVIIGGMEIIFFYLITKANLIPLQILLLFLIIFLPTISYHFLRDTFIKKFLNGKFQNIGILGKSFTYKYWLINISSAIINWYLFGFVLLLLTSRFDLIINFENFLTTSVYWSFSWILGFLIIFIPGGIGIREYLLAKLLTGSFLLSYELSIAISLFMRFFGLFAEFLLILLGLLMRKFQK